MHSNLNQNKIHVDMINHRPYENRECNLRIVEHKENMRNNDLREPTNE